MTAVRQRINIILGVFFQSFSTANKMKDSLSVCLIALFVILPLRDALLVRQPLLPVGRNSDSTFPVLIPTDTELYEKYVCKDNADGLRLLVPGSCSKYYECFNQTATVNSCGNLTPYYDGTTQSCVAQSSCVERPIEGVGGPLGCTGVCCSRPTGLYANPTNKTQFYFCSNNVGILHSCCGTEQFNPITKACDVAANCP